MRNSGVVRAAFAAVFVVVSVEAAHAQIYESVGIRAQGMGGAFVAVADDATATWWNPAGLAGGAYGNSVLEYGTLQDPRAATDATGAAVPAWRSDMRGISVAYPAFGLSYYRLKLSQIQPVTAIGTDPLSRQDPGRAPVRQTAFVLQQFGVTFGQSIGGHLVLATTLKLLHGGSSAAATVAGSASLDQAAALPTGSETHADLDIGAMARFGVVSVGATVKNLREPEFGSGDSPVDIRRQARVRLAAPSHKRAGTMSAFAVDEDADLTRTSMATGDVRHVAAGLEGWLPTGRWGFARVSARARWRAGRRRAAGLAAQEGHIRQPGDVRVGPKPKRLGSRPQSDVLGQC